MLNKKVSKVFSKGYPICKRANMLQRQILIYFELEFIFNSLSRPRSFNYYNKKQRIQKKWV